MAQLIWESVGFVSTGDIKLRVKMNDGSNMLDSSEGISFIETLNGTSGRQIGFKEFRWSLGFGVQNFNYDEFWIPPSTHEQYQQHFGSLGNGIGVVKSSGVNELPYTSYVNEHMYSSSWDINDYGHIRTYNNYWETENYSAIVTIYMPSDYWGNQINGSGGQDPNTLSYFYSDNNFFDIWGDAPFLNYHWNEQNDITAAAVDGYNILISTQLFLASSSGDNGIKIECAASDVIDNSVYLTGSSSTRYAYAPVHYTDSAYDFSVEFINLSSPNYVNEGEYAPFVLELKSNDYDGAVEIYLVDHESIGFVNEEIGDELSEWYGTLGEDVSAQYGILSFTDYESSKRTITLHPDETISIPIDYIAGNVSAGQQDTFSIFVRFKNLTYSNYGDDEYDATYQYNLLSIGEHYTYTDTMTIDVLDVNEEYIDQYNPSDNLIVQPSDIIYHLLDIELGYNENIDSVSLRNARDNHAGWEMAFSINKEIESKKLIQKISQSSKLIPTLNNNLLKFISLQNTYTGDEDIFTIKSDDVIGYSFSRTKMEDVKTQVEIKYKKDYGLDSYLESTDELKVNTHYLQNSYFKTGTYGDYINGDVDFNNYYGVKYDESSHSIDHLDTFLTFESDYIRNRQTALALAKYLLLWNCNQHNIVNLTLPLKYYSFEVGDLVEFDKMILGKKIYGESYVIDDPEDMPIRCGQYIIPLFMITETTKALNNIKIKAIQLHHMETSALNYKGNVYESTDIESGDVNNDGELDILDIIRVVQHILGTEQLTGNALTVADYNQDGNVDTLDLVSMINKIV